MKTTLRWVLSVFMVAIGITHFVFTDDFVGMVPAWLPAPALLVYLSGAAEIAGGVGLQIASLRRAAAWGLVALYVAVFPANLNMALHHLSPARMPMSSTALWARLPFQLLFIAWAWWNTTSLTTPKS